MATLRDEIGLMYNPATAQLLQQLLSASDSDAAAPLGASYGRDFRVRSRFDTFLVLSVRESGHGDTVIGSVYMPPT